MVDELGLQSVCDVGVVDLELSAQELVDFSPVAVAALFADALLGELQCGFEQGLLIGFHDDLVFLV